MTETTQKIAQIERAHLDALHILIQPIKEAAMGGEPIDLTEANKILRAWDKARKHKPAT